MENERGVTSQAAAPDVKQSKDYYIQQLPYQLQSTGTNEVRHKNIDITAKSLAKQIEKTQVPTISNTTVNAPPDSAAQYDTKYGFV